MFCARQESKAQSNIFSHHHFLLYCIITGGSPYQPFIFQLSPSRLFFLPFYSSVGLLLLHTSPFIFRFIIPFSSLLEAHAAHVESCLQLYLHQCLLRPFLCYWCAIPNANIIDYGFQFIHILSSGPASPWMSTNMSSLLTRKNRIKTAGRFLQMSEDSPVYPRCPVSCVNDSSAIK